MTKISNNLGVARPPRLYMKILIILIFLLSGCATTKFYPKDGGNKGTAYYWANQNCNRCKKSCTLFKLIDKKKIICADCYEKFYQ